MSKLQAPDKEAPGLLSICPSGEHHKLSMLVTKTGRKKVDLVRMLFEEGLKEEA